MGEVYDLSPKLIEHWEVYKEQCERGVELAEQKLARLALAGQLQLDYENLQDMPQGSPEIREV